MPVVRNVSPEHWRQFKQGFCRLSALRSNCCKSFSIGSWELRFRQRSNQTQDFLFRGLVSLCYNLPPTSLVLISHIMWNNKNIATLLKFVLWNQMWTHGDSLRSTQSTLEKNKTTTTTKSSGLLVRESPCKRSNSVQSTMNHDQCGENMSVNSCRMREKNKNKRKRGNQ